jgi:acyl-CoA synthetase (AMP-forming)/AMP-acid ligase II
VNPSAPPTARRSIFDLLLDVSERERADHLAVACGDDRASARTLVERARVTGDRLRSAGVEPGDRVAVVLPNGVGYAVAAFAVSAIGAVAVPLDPAAPAPELEWAFEQARPAAALTNDDHHTLAQVLIEHRAVVAFSRDADGAFRETPGFAQGRPAREREPTPRRRTGAVFFTSGVTGRPKGVALSERALVAGVVQLQELQQSFFRGSMPERVKRLTTTALRFRTRLLRAARRQVWMTPISFHSIAGHTFLFGGVLSGHTVVTTETFHPRTTIHAIAEDSANVLAITPGMAELLTRSAGKEQAESRRVPSLLVVGIGGGPVSAELAERVRRRFRCAVALGYGATEMGGGTLVTRLFDSQRDQLETVGRPFPGATVRVVDPSGRAVDVGAVGELVFRGPTLMDGYDDGSPLRLDNDGWFHTGDLATMDERGLVRIVGRKSEVIVRGGTNVYPQEIVEALEQHDSVVQAAVVGVAEPRAGERVWAFVIGGPDLSRDALRAHCRAKLAPRKIPDHFRIVDDLPTTRDGKVWTSELARIAGAEQLERQ